MKIAKIVIIVMVSTLLISAPAPTSRREAAAVVEQNGRFHFIDLAGNRLFNTDFDDARNFSEGLAAVRIGARWGFIDAAGNVVIGPEFERADDFANGLASVVLDDKYFYIDHSGQLLISTGFRDLGPFSDGLAPAKIDAKFGYINRYGQFAILPIFDTATPFREGFAIVSSGRKQYFIDTNGRTIRTLALDEAAKPFSEGMAAIEINHKWGYINTHGDVAIPPQYLGANSFKEGLASIYTGPKQAAFIDKTGKARITHIQLGGLGCDGSEFTEGSAVIQRDGKCELMNKAGEITAEAEPRPPALIDSFVFGRATVNIPGRGCGYMDSAGKIVIPVRFTSCTAFASIDSPESR